MLPPSPTPVCLIPPTPFHSWGSAENQWPPKAESNLSPQTWEFLRSGEPEPSDGAGRSASLTPPISSLSLLLLPPAPSTCTALEHRALRQRVFFLSFMASGQFFIVLIVSGFVLRKKKHFHIVFNFMIKLVGPLFLWLHKECGLSLPLPVTS